MQNDEKLKHLREQAESQVAKSTGDPALSSDNPEALLHELRIHQAELELQNEELRNTQLELFESRNRFQSLFEQAPVGYIALDQDGVVRVANSTFCDMLAIDHSDVIARYFNDFIHPQDQGIFLARFKAFYNAPEGKDIELRLTGKNQIINTQLTAARTQALVTRSEDKNLLLLTITDTTFLRQSQEALSRQRDFLAKLTETSPIGITYVDANGQITFANRTAESVLRLTRSEITNRLYNAPDWQITDFTGDPFPDEQLPFTLVKHTLQPVSDIQHAIKYQDGSMTFLSINASPLFDQDHAFDGMIATIEDITERKQAELALQREKEWSEKIVNYAPNIIIGLGPDSEIITFNRFAETLTGYQADEVIGEKWIDVFIPDEKKATLFQVWQEIIENKLIDHHFQNEIITRSGEIRLIDWRNTVLTEKGEFRMILSVGEDITDRKRAEEAIRQSEERYRIFFESPMFGAIHGDIYGHVYIANDEYLRIIGYTREELENGDVNWENITPKEFLPLDRERIAEAQQRGVCTPYEKQYIRKDGSLIWVLVGYALYGENRDEAMAFIIDIQESKEYQETLEKQNEFIQTVLDNLPIGVALNEVDSGTATYINDKFAEIYGWTREELANIATFFQKVYPDEAFRRDLQRRVMEDIASKDPSRMHWEDLVVTHQDGSHGWINAENIPLFQQNVMVSTVMDITSLKKTQQELLQIKENLEAEVAAKTRELQERVEQLERYHDATVNREFRIRELKDEIARLKQERNGAH